MYMAYNCRSDSGIHLCQLRHLYYFAHKCSFMRRITTVEQQNWILSIAMYIYLARNCVLFRIKAGWLGKTPNGKSRLYDILSPHYRIPNAKKFSSLKFKYFILIKKKKRMTLLYDFPCVHWTYMQRHLLFREDVHVFTKQCTCSVVSSLHVCVGHCQ